MSSLEEYFSSAVLALYIPDTSLEFPPSSPTDQWLGRLRETTSERSLAFFDEHMSYFLTVQIDHPSTLPPANVENPPNILLNFLAHLQISIEAMFISSIPSNAEISPQPSILLSAPPRMNASKLSARTHHPSIFPPSTPNPMPSAAQNDKPYLNAEGTMLFSGIWGQDASEPFALLWSDAFKCWVAVFKMSLSVAYTRLPFASPLLCVTAAVTLRERPLALLQSKSALRSYLTAFSEFANYAATPTSADAQLSQDQQQETDRFEEVNLLEGLAAGPTFHPSSIFLPSSRLGSDSRKELFSLPPVKLLTPATPTPSPMTAARAVHPTLRKAFRKTLHVVSGIQMRMRTTFVPAVLLPDGANDEQEERDMREAGNEERTVVLCLEVENPDEGNTTDFIVDAVEIQVGDEGAKATLIGWGDSIVNSNVFPLRIGPQGQYNLLYTVSFLQSPEENDGLLSVGGNNQENIDLRRNVNINIIGKPSPRSVPDASFPTGSFTSKWSTILNLSPRRPLLTEDQASEHEVLPTPASPFPVTAVTAASSMTARRSSLAVGSRTNSPSPVPHNLVGPKRHTAPASALAGSSLFPRRPPTPGFPLPPRSSATTGSSLRMPYSPIPPSAQLSGAFPKSPTTFDALYDTKSTLPEPPLTPAYPAYPTTPGYSASPPSQFPGAAQSNTYVGPSVEMRRDRGPGMPGDIPATPLQSNFFGYVEDEPQPEEPIVVSVGLLEDQDYAGGFEISVHKTFTLDIFVYNRSTRTRRLEVSYPDRRTRRRNGSLAGKGDIQPGVLPLDNRVRIGPLLPTACQSVRMRFLAMMAGVHSIDTLTLTDVESGYSMNLRSVMDIVVHE